jgi:hypothetical protein
MSEHGVAVTWRKSSRCEAGHCVEIASLGDQVGLRNSTRPQQTLTVSAAAFRALLAGVKAGDFDR